MTPLLAPGVVAAVLHIARARRLGTPPATVVFAERNAGAANSVPFNRAAEGTFCQTKSPRGLTDAVFAKQSPRGRPAKHRFCSSKYPRAGRSYNRGVTRPSDRLPPWLRQFFWDC